MINTMIGIGLYLILAILLGYLFGWLITKTSLEEQYKKQLKAYYNRYGKKAESIEKIKQELSHYKKINEKLIAENNRLSLDYQGQKYVLDENNATLDEFQRLLKSKNDIIEKLTVKLSTVEEKQKALKEKYDSEIDAFLFERIDLTQKYKTLLDKLKESENFKDLEKHESWFSKIFEAPTKN